MNTEPTHTGPVSALQAILARMNGEYDHPALVQFGPLSVSTDADVMAIAEAAISRAASHMDPLLEAARYAAESIYQYQARGSKSDRDDLSVAMQMLQAAIATACPECAKTGGAM